MAKKSCEECGEQGCASCPSQRPPQKLTPEQLLALQKRMKEEKKRQEAFMKDAKPLGMKQVKILKQMAECPDCKEYEYKFVPCKKHYKQMEETVKEAQKLQFYYRLKDDISRALKVP